MNSRDRDPLPVFGPVLPLIRIGLLLLAGAGCAPHAARSEDRPNVLWITLSGLRPDHLSACGYERPTDPWFATNLVPRGRLYLEAAARPGFVESAVAELVTGRSFDSLVREGHPLNDPNRRRLLPKALTFAEILRLNGYDCAAFSHVPWLGPADRSFAQGFDTFVLNRIPVQYPWPRLGITRRGAIFEDAAVWIRGRDRPGRPWFVWIYSVFNRPPLDVSDEFVLPWDEDGVYQSFSRRERGLLRRFHRRGDRRFTRDEAEAVRILYDGTVSYVDRWLQAFFEQLDSKNLLDDTLVIVSGDVPLPLPVPGCPAVPCDAAGIPRRIPLLVIRPSGRWAGTIDTETASLVAVAPTLLDFLGIRRPGRMADLTLMPSGKEPSP